MGSRVRENPDKLFEVFAEVAKPESGQDPFILQYYPPDYHNNDVLKTIPKFAFPCDVESTTVEHFTFVMTDLEGQFTFGFCRYATGAQTCLCIVSVLPWYGVFYKQLNLLAELLNRSENNDLVPLLESMYHHEIPMPGVPVTIVAKQEMFSFTSPDSSVLPSITTSRNLSEYYNAIDTNNMMNIFASMLNERRMIFTSKKLSRLTACIHGAESLLYPMHWQHLFIPVLPSHLIDILTAPMPYVIGVHTTLMSKVRLSDVGDAVIVDADRNTIETEHDDLNALPDEVASYLKKNLKGDRVKSSMMDSGDAISKAFLKALVILIGGYRDALKFHTGEPITFEPEAFVTSRPQSMQPFLENMLQLQIFQQFIKGRLEILNCGNGFNDLFEKEAVLHADKLSTQSKYKEWASNMKRQGKKFQKSGREVFSDVREKAPIMMNSAVQLMKSQGKKAVSEIKSKWNESSKSSERRDIHSHRFPDRSRPATIVGPEIRSNRPPRPAQLPRSVKLKERVSTSYRLINVTEDESTTDEMEYQRISMGLMKDPDIQRVVRRPLSTENEASDDSSSVGTPSSGAQTPAEMEDSGIPYMDLESNTTSQVENIVDTDFTPLPRSSPIITKSNGTPCKPIQGPPVPPPRSRSSRVVGVRPPVRPPRPHHKEEQLIRFESTESDPDGEFDPLSKTTMSGTPKAEDPTAAGFDRSRVQRRSLINRSPAFRSPGQDTPKRQTYKPDNSPENSEPEDPSVLFDPLAGFDKSKYSTPTSSKPAAESDSSLLHDWSFRQLTSSPVVTPPPCRSPVPTSSSNPAYNMTVPTRSTPPIPKPRLSTGHLQKSNLFANSASGKTSPAAPQNDLFSDLVDLQFGPQISKPAVNIPSKKDIWETFD